MSNGTAVMGKMNNKKVAIPALSWPRCWSVLSDARINGYAGSSPIYPTTAQ